MVSEQLSIVAAGGIKSGNGGTLGIAGSHNEHKICGVGFLRTDAYASSIDLSWRATDLRLFAYKVLPRMSVSVCG